MKIIRKEAWVTIFLSITALVCLVAFNLTPDNLYNPAWDVYNHKVAVETVEVIDEASERYYLNVSGVDERLDTLLFYTNHQEVFVYSGEELLYSLKSSDSMFGRTPGAMWNKVALPVDAERLEVVVNQVYPDQTKQVPEFELGNSYNIYRDVVAGAAAELIMAGAIVVIGIALVLYWMVVFFRSGEQRALLYLGFFAIIFGIWNLGETRFVVFLFEKRAFFSYLAFTCLMTMGLPAIQFFREFLEVEDKYVHKIISVYIVAETIIAQALHISGVAGVKQTALFTLASTVLIIVYLVYAIIKGVMERKNMQKIAINIIGLLILVITAAIDMNTYFVNVMSTEKVAKIGFLIYTIILGFETTRVASEKLQEERKIELLREMAIKDMLTDCFNRNAYTEDVSEMESLEDTQVVILDLNDLKKCNDVLGHKAGDTYISDAAKLIKQVFENTGKLYRVGGDEFCIIAKNVSEATLEKKRALLKLATEHYRLEHPDRNFGIACGYATYDATVDKTIEDIRHRADMSMYENKKEIKGSN